MPRTFTSTATFRIAAFAVVVLAGLGAGYLILGQRQDPSELETAEATSDAAGPLRPSYLVSVREPTPEEWAQRKALSDVNVRSGPGTGSSVMSVASAGSKVQVLEQQGGWTRVTLPAGGEGWIASKFLAKN
ncbi:MAG TPA: SH3 domain-containing protein [Devosia sp.]